MTDPIQATSRLPLPPNQTLMGARDPNVQNSNRATQDENDKVAGTNKDKNQTDFKDYLDKQEIMTVKKVKKELEFDPAADIVNASAYAPAGRSSPV